MRKIAAGAWICFFFGTPALAGTAPGDPSTINRIGDAGFNHSEVAEIAAHLTDQIGGRMTNSPAMRQAQRWTQDQFKRWGLKDVRTEGFDFGRGWWIESSSVRMSAPRPLQLRGIPIAWTPRSEERRVGKEC